MEDSMNSLSGITVIGIAVSAMFHFVVSFASAQVSPPNATPLIVGTWKLNTQKSGLGNVPPAFMHVRQYQLRQDGFLVGLAISVNYQGEPTFLQFAAKSDGNDYPEFSEGLLADFQASNKPTTRTYSEKVIDAYTSAWTDKDNGQVIASGTRKVSTDGKTMTLSSDVGRDLVFDRQ